jgi:hypothetical protein
VLSNQLSCGSVPKTVRSAGDWPRFKPQCAQLKAQSLNALLACAKENEAECVTPASPTIAMSKTAQGDQAANACDIGAIWWAHQGSNLGPPD